MADVIVIDYQVNIDKLESELRKTENDFKNVDKASKKSMTSVGVESNKAAKEVKKVDKQVNDLSSSLSDVATHLPFAGAISDIQNFGSAITKTTKSGSSAFSSLGKAMIALPIFALIAGFTSLIAYFKRTDQGATQLEGVMGAVGAVMDRVTGSIAEFGSRAIKAFQDPVQAIKDLGIAIFENIINRFTSIITLFEAFAAVAGGDFDKAITKLNDTVIQFTTGVKDGSQQISDFYNDILAVATASYELAIALDNLNDRQREFNIQSAKNRNEVEQLIIQSKSRALTARQSIELLDQAAEIEKANVKEQLALERERLVLIQRANKIESDSINQSLNRKIKLAKTDAERLDLERQRLDISDELADKEAAQQIRIIELEGQSLALQDRIQVRREARIEQAITQEVNAQKLKFEALGNLEKQRFLDAEINQETLNSSLEENEIASLEAQKAILQKYGKDVIEIEQQILNLRIKQRSEANKAEKDRIAKDQAEILAELDRSFKEESNFRKQQLLDGQVTQEAFNREEIVSTIDLLEQKRQLLIEQGKDTIDIEQQILDQKIKLYNQDKQAFDKVEKEKSDNAKALQQARSQFVQQSITELNDFLFEVAQQKNQEEIAEAQNQANAQTAIIDKQVKAGVISEEFAAARKQQIQEQLAKKEAELKRKQAISDKLKALFDIAINTAAAILKQLAATPLPVGAPFVALIAAQAAIQGALVAARPIPKFKDGVIGFNGIGTETSDSNLAYLSRNESVISARNTRKYRGELTAINDDRFDKYINDSWVLPAVKEVEKRYKQKMQREQADLMKPIIQELDTSHLERLTKNNKSVQIANSKQLAKDIASYSSLGHNMK